MKMMVSRPAQIKENVHIVVFFWEEHIKHSLREQAKKFILNEAR